MPRINFSYAGEFKPNAKLIRSRMKLCENIDRQIAAIKDPSYQYFSPNGTKHRPHSWVSYDFANDSAHVGLRYGSWRMKRNGIPFGIVVAKANPQRIVSALKLVKQDVATGKLDADLVEARTLYW